MKFHRRANARTIGRVMAATGTALGASSALAMAATPAGPTGGESAAAAGDSGAGTPVHESSSGRAVTLHVKAAKNVLAHSSDRVRGSLSVQLSHQTVIVEALRSGSWQTVASTRTGRRGRFSTTWSPSDVGRYAVRARLADGSAQAKAKGRVTAYRESNISYYGPGFYGQRTACGETLQPDTLGVANKTLPCGTKVALRYNGRSVTVPVIDRGPYVSGREYDLTAATRDRINAPSTGTIWTAPLG